MCLGAPVTWEAFAHDSRLARVVPWWVSVLAANLLFIFLLGRNDWREPASYNGRMPSDAHGKIAFAMKVVSIGLVVMGSAMGYVAWLVDRHESRPHHGAATEAAMIDLRRDLADLSRDVRGLMLEVKSIKHGRPAGQLAYPREPMSAE